MNLREPEKQILDDFEHKVTNKIEKYGANADFPKFENYGITRMDLDDYLFDKQAIFDMGGSKRTQLTVGGFITVIPVLILSCFPDKSPIYENGKAITTVIAIIIGLLLACFFKALLQMSSPIVLTSTSKPRWRPLSRQFYSTSRKRSLPEASRKFSRSLPETINYKLLIINY